jgi:O-antigen ligase
MTKTRSAWIAMAMIFILYGMMVERKYLLYLVLISLGALLIPSVHERVIDLFAGNSIENITEGEPLNSYAWRKVVWLASWDYIINKPILGHGYDTFSYYFLEFTPLEGEKGYDAHNVYVQIAFDMGFLGLFAYLIIFIGIMIRLFKLFVYDKKGGVILIALLFSYMLVCMSDNMLYYLSYNWYFWFLMGVFYYIPSHILKAEDGETEHERPEENTSKQIINSTNML